MAVIVSILNPLRFYQAGYTSPYHTKFLDLYPFNDSIRSHDQPLEYCQPWEVDDHIILQIKSNEAPTIRFYRESDGGQQYTEAFVQGAADDDNPGYYLYEVDVDLNDVGEGHYTVKITTATTTLISNEINVSDSHPDSVYLTYKHFQNYEDTIFESGIEYGIRVYGFLKYSNPEKTATVYRDQITNLTPLKQVNWRLWRFYTRSEGIPDYMIDLISRVFGCDDLTIDGRGFVAPEDAKWEESEEDYYPLRGWTINIEEADNNSSNSFEESVGEPGGGSSNTKPYSDWWVTTPASNEVSGNSAVWGYDTDDIVSVLLVAREGTEVRVITSGTPGNRQVKWDGSLKKLVFPVDLPFESGETVTILFLK